MSGLRPARGVGVVEDDGVVYAAPLPDGPIAVLDGTAAVIWEEACRGGSASLAARVAARTDASAGAIAAEVAGFVDDLIRLGLLEPAGE